MLEFTGVDAYEIIYIPNVLGEKDIKVNIYKVIMGTDALVYWKEKDNKMIRNMKARLKL
jgi:hypothetical protein